MPMILHSPRKFSRKPMGTFLLPMILSRTSGFLPIPCIPFFFIAPLTLVSFDLVQAVGIVLVPVLAGLVTIGWMIGLGWRTDWRGYALAGALGMTALPALELATFQQPTILVATLLAAVAVALLRNWNGLAGCLLACATIKPQLVVLLIVWLLLWALLNWKTRNRLLLGFSMTLTLLLAGAFLLWPSWFSEWLQVLGVYRKDYMFSNAFPGPLVPDVAATDHLVRRGPTHRYLSLAHSFCGAR